MEYIGRIMWFVGGFLLAISVGLFYGASYGFLFAGCFVIISLFFAALIEII